MGDGSNSINYHRVGVIRENPMRCIYTADDQGEIFIVSSSEFENRTDLKDGDCCVVDFKTNFSEELGNGVYNAEIYKYDSVAVWPLHETLTDTTVVLDKERLVTLDFKKSIYLEGRFFLQTQHVNHQVDQKDIFNLSYTPDQEVEKDDDGLVCLCDCVRLFRRRHFRQPESGMASSGSDGGGNRLPQIHMQEDHGSGSCGRE